MEEIAASEAKEAEDASGRKQEDSQSEKTLEYDAKSHQSDENYDDFVS